MQTIWKGAVSFGLVNVPVKMYTATQDNDIPMKMLHKEFNVPIHYNRTCPKCEKEVSWSDIVKGYEYEPGHYVTFEKEELEKLAAKTSREIRILDFVELKEIDPIFYQKTYYLAPEQNGAHAYRLLVKALLDTNMVGVANVSIRSKSSLAAIRIVDGVLAMSTMYYAEEVRGIEQIPNLPEEEAIDERELELARLLISQLTTSFDPDKYEDDYRSRLMEAIEDKVEGKEVKFAPEAKKTNVIDLMEALQASLQKSKDTSAGKAQAGNRSVEKPTAELSRKAKPKSKGTRDRKAEAGQKDGESTQAKKPVKRETSSKKTRASSKEASGEHSKSSTKTTRKKTGA